MLTDKQIYDLADEFVRSTEYNPEVIPQCCITDFARAIEKAVIEQGEQNVNRRTD